VAAIGALDPDELAALDGIVAFLRECANDPVFLLELMCRRAARAYAEAEAREADLAR
jgi:hypothetical protein